jgi:Uma2 family endonuclease
MTLLDVETDALRRRRPILANEYFAMVEAGVFARRERIELIDGEILRMPAKGSPHVAYQSDLLDFASRTLDRSFRVLVEPSIKLSRYDVPEPDIVVVRRGERARPIDGHDLLLAIEVADSSAAYDLGPKAALYARHGVPELWVVEIAKRRTHVHRDPSDEGYRTVTAVSFDVPLDASLLPGFAPLLGAMGEPF